MLYVKILRLNLENRFFPNIGYIVATGVFVSTSRCQFFISLHLSGRSRISQGGDGGWGVVEGAAGSVANFQGGGVNLLFNQISPQNCMKM